MARRRGIFHLSGSKKHQENSFRGINRAVREHKAWIDLDLQITRDGAIVATHWPRPLLRDGFRDPARKISRFAKVSNLSLAEVQRLRTRDGYRIRTLDEMFAHAGPRIGVVVEPKGDARFRDEALWRRVAASARRHKVHLRAYALRANKSALPFVRAAGIPEHVLSH